MCSREGTKWLSVLRNKRAFHTLIIIFPNGAHLRKLLENTPVSFCVRGVERSRRPRQYMDVSGVWRILLP
jgi:hypothetical protein